MPSLSYRPEIDGLRALAVVPVIVFHAGFPFFGGGFVGVDVFFVISGYLITSIIVRELDRDSFSILTFYERRARRILPALVLVVLCCLPLAWLTMLPVPARDFAQSVAATGLFSSNFLFWMETGYFAPEAELKPLLHTWSLAVEEQFYIVFPLLLIALCSLGARKHLVLGLLALASFVLCLWASANAPSANYYLLPFRAWELLIGALCALAAHRTAESDLLSLAGLALVVASVLFIGDAYPYPDAYTLAPVAGTAMLVLFCSTRTAVGRALAFPPVVFVGLISYSAYLWHQPLFAFARISHHQEPPLATMLALTFATFLLAFLTWKFVERPFRDRRRIARKPVLAASFASLVALVALGTLGHVRNGFDSRFPEPALMASGQLALPGRGNGYCFYNINETRTLPVLDQIPDCRIGGHDTEARVLLFGDSFAAHWEPFFDRLGKEHGIAIDVVATNWCHPTAGKEWVGPSGHKSYRQCLHNREFLTEHASDYDAVIVAGAWHLVEGQHHSRDSMSFLDTLLDQTAVRLIVMDAPPFYQGTSVEFGVFDPDKRLVADRGRELASSSYWSALESRIGDEDDALLIGKDQVFSKLSDRTGEGYPFSLDGAHLSVHGSLELYSLLSDGATVERILHHLR